MCLKLSKTFVVMDRLQGPIHKVPCRTCLMLRSSLRDLRYSISAHNHNFMPHGCKIHLLSPCRYVHLVLIYMYVVPLVVFGCSIIWMHLYYNKCIHKKNLKTCYLFGITCSELFQVNVRLSISFLINRFLIQKLEALMGCLLRRMCSCRN